MHSSMFIEEGGIGLVSLPKGKFPIVEANNWHAISIPFTHDEIKKVIFNMALLKAPGLDGFHADFYRKTWNQVSEIVNR